MAGVGAFLKICGKVSVDAPQQQITTLRVDIPLNVLIDEAAIRLGAKTPDLLEWRDNERNLHVSSTRCCGSTFKALDLVEPCDELRHHDVITAGEMGLGHRNCYPACWFEGSTKIVLPASNQFDDSIDVKIQNTAVLVSVALRKRRLTDA